MGIRQLAPTPVPTHGDPNLANLLVDPHEMIYLTDWGEVALGPRERDLVFFTGDRFAPFLRAYAAVAGRIRLYPLLFTFYTYRWALQEIADYITRLFSDSTVEGQEYAWEELQPYLPIPHETMRASVEEVVRVVRDLATAGIVELADTDTDPN